MMLSLLLVISFIFIHKVVYYQTHTYPQLPFMNTPKKIMHTYTQKKTRNKSVLFPQQVSREGLGIFPLIQNYRPPPKKQKDNHTSKTTELLIQKCIIFEDLMLSDQHNYWYSLGSAFFHIQKVIITSRLSPTSMKTKMGKANFSPIK